MIRTDIARAIICAQVASDAGKGIDDLYEQISHTSDIRRAAKLGYSDKDGNILKAINKILCSNREFKFYVCADVERKAKYLVYFNFRLNGKRYQVSFHSFNEKLAVFIDGSKPHETAWDGRDCREACLALAREINL